MKRISILLFPLLLLAGCYDDKGNYDYKDINKLQIESFDNIVSEAGSTITVDAVVTPEIDTESGRYGIRWYIDMPGGEIYTEEGWNKLRFEWEPDFVIKEKNYMDPYLVLEITDHQNGDVKYIQRAEITVNPEFVSDASILILSDVGGESQLHFVKYEEFEEVEDEVTESIYMRPLSEPKVYYNVYAERNNGEKLGTGPISLYEHYIYEDGGQYVIFQQSGAVDVERDNMEKVIDFSTMFKGGSYPAGVDYLTGGNMMSWVDALTDQQGRVFVRLKNTYELYNSGIFADTPAKYDGKELSNCTIYRMPYRLNYFSVVNDPDNGRMLALWDGDTDWYGSEFRGAGKIGPIADEYDPDDNVRSFNDLSGCEVFNVTTRLYMTCVTYLDTQTGKYYHQETDLYPEYLETEMTNGGSMVWELDLPGKPDNTYMPITYDTHYLFLSYGEKLYVVDLDSGSDTAELYFTADSPITSICSHGYDGGGIFFGTEGGYVYGIITANAKNKIPSGLTDEDILLYKKGGFGKIVSLICPDGRNHETYQ